MPGLEVKTILSRLTLWEFLEKPADLLGDREFLGNFEKWLAERADLL